MAGESPPSPQDRVHLLAQVVQEHEQYQANVDEFQLWLQAVVEKAHSCLGRNRKLSPTHRLSALQVSLAWIPPKKPLGVHVGAEQGVLPE